MKTHEFDAILKDTLQSNEIPPPGLIYRAKYAAAGGGQRVKHLARTLAVAAACIFLVGGSVTAYATNFLGLRDLILRGAKPDPSVQLISLQGFAGSREYAAAAEWQNFLSTYDAQAAAAAAGNDWGGVPEEYRDYRAYDMTMAEKIREITGKYGLSLFGKSTDLAQEALQASIANGPLFTDKSIRFGGYLFESGTFQFDAEQGNLIFQFRSSRKGVFDNVFLNVGDIAQYAEWNYTNAHGTPLLLLQSREKSLILLETDAAFIVVNVLAGTDGLFARGELEHLADLIDFGQLK